MLQFHDLHDCSRSVEDLHVGLQTLTDLTDRKNCFEESIQAKRLTHDPFTRQLEALLNRQRVDLKGEFRWHVVI